MQSGVEGDAGTALLALEEAAAAEIIPALEGVLQDDFAALDVRVWLVDYRLTVLQTVTGADSVSVPGEVVPVDGTSVGRTFASQRPAVEPSGDYFQVQLPVSVRGDRLGVLAVTLAAQPTGGQVESLSRVARALGHSVIVAGRQSDQFERPARAQRLSLAAELQWQILPGRGCSGPDFDLAGQLEPAYHVAGDAFDWSVAPGHLMLGVHEGMGSGTAAAQATNLAVTALRNARRADLSLDDQATMAGDAIFGLYGGRHWIGSVLLRFDRASGTVTAIDAGSPKVLRQRDRHIEEVVLDKQLPLGKFEGTGYQPQTFEIGVGDRLVIVSDGVHEAAPSGRRPFGESELLSVLRASRNLSPSEAVRQIIRALRAHHDRGEIDDDGVAVVLDWHRP